MQYGRIGRSTNAVRHHFAALKFQATSLRLSIALKYNPKWHLQPRAPRGSPEGGRWIAGGRILSNLGPVILPPLKEAGRIALRIASQKARRNLILRLPKYWAQEDIFPSEDDFDIDTSRIGLPSNRRPDIGLVRFKSFDEAKRYLGPAGDGMEWHHIVEQRTAEYGLFPAEVINSTDNFIALPVEVHECITRKMQSRFLGLGARMRYVIEPQPFPIQFNVGIDLIKICLRRYGYDPARY